MTLDRIKGLMKNKRELVPVAFLAIAVLFGVLTVSKVTGFFTALAKAENIVKQAVAQSSSNPNILKTPKAKVNPLVDELKKNNLFSPPAPNENPVKDVLGIFGDEAYINGKWYKVGAKVGNAKIISIDAASVTTEWEGDKQVFYPIDAESSFAPGGPKSESKRPTPKKGAMGGKQTDMIIVQSEASPRRNSKEGRPEARNERQLSDLERAKMKEKMQKVLKR